VVIKPPLVSSQIESKQMFRVDEDEIDKLEIELGIPKGFFNSLLEDNDWAFVVKLHAFLESAVTFLLAEAVDPKLKRVLGQLEMSNKKTGKLAFLSALEILESRSYRFISKLSELRNELVHNVKNISFSLPEYVNNMDNQQLKSFMINYCPFGDEGFEKKDKWVNFAKTEPRKYIFNGATYLFTRIYNIRQISFNEKETARLIKELPNEA